MNKLVKLLAIAGVCTIFAACSTTPKPSDTDKVAAVDATNSSVAYDPIKDPKSVVYGKRSIWFDFDSSMIKPEYQSFLQAHADYLRANKNKSVHILIQGNTDERGTAEYNLALGQRRSEAVKKFLTILGVDASQIEAVSLGKEKPMNEGHDESAWKANRRADIIYK